MEGTVPWQEHAVHNYSEDSCVLPSQPSLFIVFCELVDIESRQSKYDSVGKQITTRSLKCLFICSTSRHSFITSPTAFLMGKQICIYIYLHYYIVSGENNSFMLQSCFPTPPGTAARIAGINLHFQIFFLTEKQSHLAESTVQQSAVGPHGSCLR